jgi:LPXTG-motif cell wall-anchored protein
MIKKVLGLAALLMLVLTPSALAQDYPPGTPGATVSDTTPAPGQPITIIARGFLPASTVTFDLFSAPVRLGTAVADSNGTATLTATIPASTPPGVHHIEASGTGANGQPRTVSIAITVTGTQRATVPRTGSNSSLPMAEIGVGALAVGGLLVLMARRRSKVSAAA